MQVAILKRDDRLRPKAERLIADVYAQHHGACIRQFPDALIARIGEDDDIDCAAGLRFAADGFFSEAYLDVPIEMILSVQGSASVRREKIFEVTLLASRSPHLVGSFLRKVIAGGEAAGFDWSFFTATAPLRALLKRLDLPLALLARAERTRVETPEDWGSYYTLAPYVCAIDRDSVAAWLGGETQPCRDACWGPHAAALCGRSCNGPHARMMWHG